MLRFALLRAKTLISISKTLASSSFVRPQLFFTTQSRSSIAHDLTTTHGFPPESAETLASLIDPKRVSRYPAVLSLFRNYGFGHSDISSIMSRQPLLLNADANNTLKPKIDALVRHGFERPMLIQVINRDPFLLRLSALARLIPCLQCLTRFFGSTQKVVDLLLIRRGTMVLHKFNPNMKGNIDALRKKGVSDASIVRMMLIKPSVLCRDLKGFRMIVKEIQELGMDVKSSMFVYGVISRGGMKKDKWLSKVDVFKQFGWTERQLSQLIVKLPKVMDSSSEKIEKLLEYFLNQLGWNRIHIETYPTLLLASLQNRIMPRMIVLNELLDKGLINKKAIPQGLRLTDKDFREKYLVEYKDHTKQLLETL